MSKLHILSNPENPVHINNRIDPFSIAIVKFISNMNLLGWESIHYGVQGCEVECETVICQPTLSSDHSTNVKNYNEQAAYEIGKRKSPDDIILCFHGWENQVAALAHKELKIVEPSIGYMTSAIFAPFRVFTSYAQMHMFYGERNMLMNPSWYDAVIPNAFTASEFDYNENKKDYILYFGRVVEAKGIHIAIQATERAGVPLVIAGPGTLEELGYKSIPDHVTTVGLCNAEQRKTLMRDAKAIIGPTYYVEPFGNMVVEGYFSGTPAITSDWGGFTETVINGHTGFRCREMRDFVNAIKTIDIIEPINCRKYALMNYEECVVHKKFDEYFKKILTGDFYRL